MKLKPNGIYHIYNRGNNKQKIFLLKQNYEFFIQKIDRQLSGTIDLLAYCLMPNHFHLMVSTSENFERDVFTNKYRILLSSYTRAINKQEERTGSLFQQNSKSVEITGHQHALICMNYIHLNPVKAGLANSMENWRYSSIHEYTGSNRNNLCNTALATELIDLPHDPKDFISFSKGASGGTT